MINKVEFVLMKKKFFYLLCRLLGKRRAVIHFSSTQYAIVIPDKNRHVCFRGTHDLYLEDDGSVTDCTMLWRGIPSINKVPGVTWEWLG